MHKTDEELIQEFKNGQKGALETLMNRYQLKIFNFCLRFVGQRADAEDVTQEVMMGLMNDKYRPQSNAKFSTWLFTVARNSCISHLRKRKRFSFLSFIDSESENTKTIEIPDTQNISREQLNTQETAALIKAAVSTLPLKQREVLILREYEGMNYAQISDVTGQSLENVKILLFRARENLREKLSVLLKEVL